MKINIYILILISPVFAFAQQPMNTSSPMSYSWQYVGNNNFSYPFAGNPSLVFNPTNNQPYVAYGGMLWDYQGFATVKKFNGTSWEAVGDTSFSAGSAQRTSLAFNQSGQPYVAYVDNGNLKKATVMKFDGNNWVNVGNAGFSLYRVDYTSLAFNPSDDQPYVAFQDYATGQNTTVMKFDGTNWVTVGNEGFSSMSEYISLAFNPSDAQPYVAFKDGAAKATVMKFNGTNWVTVGNAGFSNGTVSFTSLAFSPSGVPYIAFEDYADSAKVTVMKFDGTNWIYVGNEGFSAGSSSFMRLAFSPSDNQPYVTYYESNANSLGTCLMKFDGTDWVYVGVPDFSDCEANSGLSLAFSPQGQPYVAFSNGNNYYQINVMKYDSVLVSVNEPKELPFRYYPNPTSNLLTADFTDIIGAVKSVEIDNLSGVKLLEKTTIESRMTIDVETLSSGIYLLKVKTKNSCYFRKIYKI